MSELLPCPFCGKNAKSIHKRLVGYKIMCMWCHTSTPNYRLDAKMAKADWNRRADHVNELVAAAYEDAASIVRREAPVDAHPDSYIAWLHQDIAKTVLNLTPADATAALAARDARVREAALKEAAAKLDDLHQYAKDHHSKDYRQGHEAALAGGSGVLRALAEKGGA